MQILKQKLGTFWWGVLFLTLLGAVTYLPFATQMGYSYDDWYLMFDGYVGGADFFHEVFAIDRPLRGFLMQAAFSLFGMEPLYYHMSAFLFRAVSAAALFWLGEQLWHSRTTYNWLAALIFFVYPGFLSQVNPIDYQSQIFSLACGMVSVALTVKALQARSFAERWVNTLVAVLLAWVYLGLVEYFLGFEALRLGVVAVLTLRRHGDGFLASLPSVLRAFSPFLAGAGGFLIWRLFFFEAERQATDVSLQLSAVFSSPLTGLWWLNYLIQDVFKVVLVAWTQPLNSLGFSLRLRDAFIGFALAGVVVTGGLVFLRHRVDKAEETRAGSMSGEMREQLWLAFITIIACLLPVIMVNRHITLPEYSRYALASAAGAGILISVFIEQIRTTSLRMGGVAFLLAVAVLTHHGNTMRVVDETAATREFWWQVAWRAPMIDEGVTLIVSYPGSPLAEDYFIWGPANFIYYPEKQDGNPVEIKLPAAVLNGDAVNKIVTGGGIESPLRRGNYLQRNYGSILLMIQTHSNGCVRFINGDAPELSQWDAERLVLVAPHSQLDAVITDGASPQPPAIVFGDEPEQGWCYFYQKADLARQRRDWDGVLALLDEALKQGHYPNDPLEWMPFIQAHAVDGNVVKVRQLAALVTTDRVQRVRTCRVMRDLSEKENLSVEVNDFIENKICN